MEEQTRPKDLEDLFVNPEIRTKQAIINAVGGKATMPSVGWGFYPEAAFDDLTLGQKIVCMLLARKGAKIAKKTDNDRLSKGLILGPSGINDNSYRPTIVELERQGLVKRDGDEVWVSDETVIRASQYVEGKYIPSSSSRPLKSTDKKIDNPPPEAEEEINDSESAKDVPDNVVVEEKKSKTPGQINLKSPRRRKLRELYQGKMESSPKFHPGDFKEPLDQCLSALAIAEDTFRISELRAKDISRLLKERFNVNISKAGVIELLDGVKGRYVNYYYDAHFKAGMYSLLEQGVKYLGEHSKPLSQK
jgi:hypothetical protein